MIQMTLFQLAAEGARRLEESGSPDAGNDARQLLMAAFHLDTTHFLLDRMQPLPDSGKTRSAIRLYQEMIEQRRSRIPLQQILGVQEFMGLEFYVNRHVLIPRQDTETLVELVLKEHRAGDSLLDLCTGSGCIAISLALKGQFTSVTATDISGEALEVAKRNAEKLLGAVKAEKAASEAAEPEKAASEAAEPGIIGQEREEPEKEGLVFCLCQGDLFEALPRTASGDTPRYDIITANPPYIPTDIIPTLEPEVPEAALLPLPDKGVGGAPKVPVGAVVNRQLGGGGKALWGEVGQKLPQAPRPKVQDILLAVDAALHQKAPFLPEPRPLPPRAFRRRRARPNKNLYS